MRLNQHPTSTANRTTNAKPSTTPIRDYNWASSQLTKTAMNTNPVPNQSHLCARLIRLSVKRCTYNPRHSTSNKDASKQSKTHTLLYPSKWITSLIFSQPSTLKMAMALSGLTPLPPTKDQLDSITKTGSPSSSTSQDRNMPRTGKNLPTLEFSMVTEVWTVQIFSEIISTHLSPNNERTSFLRKFSEPDGVGYKSRFWEMWEDFFGSILC